jgi:tetratricopeptide (TPR) repeat protein
MGNFAVLLRFVPYLGIVIAASFPIALAIALVDRALVLNPSYANGWCWSGLVRNWGGRPDLALEHFASFLRLSPRERFPFYLTAIGIALFFERRFDEVHWRGFRIWD